MKKFLNKEAQESIDGQIEFGEALRAIERNEFELENASDQIKNNKVVVQAAVTKRGKALDFASDDMKNTEDVVMAAVTQDGQALKWASKEMKNNEAVVLAAVTQNGMALEFASDVWKNNEAVVLAAVTQNWEVLKNLSDAMKTNEAVVLAVDVTQDGALHWMAGEKAKAALSADSLTDGVRIFESTHPYEKGMGEETLIEFEGAAAIAIIFDERSCSEDKDDYLRFRRSAGSDEKPWIKDKFFGDRESVNYIRRRVKVRRVLPQRR